MFSFADPLLALRIECIIFPLLAVDIQNNCQNQKIIIYEFTYLYCNNISCAEYSMSDWPIFNEEQFSESQGDDTSQSDIKKVVPFAVRACDFCKKRKIRCEGTIPCIPCQRRGQVCTFTREQSKRGPKPKRVRRDPAPVTSARSVASDGGSELVSLQPLSQDLSKLKIELEIQKRLEDHWKQQYFDLLQQQQNNQLAVGMSNIPAYLRSIFVENNATGLALESEPGSQLIGQFSTASWGLIRDPDAPLKLQTSFVDGNMCGTVPTYKMTLPVDDPVNALIWKVLMNNTPEKISDFLRHETTPLVMQFLQSAVIFAQGTTRLYLGHSLADHTLQVCVHSMKIRRI